MWREEGRKVEGVEKGKEGEYYYRGGGRGSE